MSDFAKGLQATLAFTRRWKESLAARKNRIFDDRDSVLQDALKNVEARSDDTYAAVLSYDLNVTALWNIDVTDLGITGTNLVNGAEFASGTTADSTGALTFTAVLPGEQTITVTITDNEGGIAVAADALAGTIAITHDGDTATDIAAAVNADPIAKYMVDATVRTAGVIDADETVVAETNGADPGSLPVLHIGASAVDGSAAGTGITAWTDTTITFDFDGTGFAVGSSQMLRLWVDDVLVLCVPLKVSAD